mmetsp:Transcript_50397/g.145256  ORF Transcript_50397/g.145256 Transcript_50397/m.145256 type:complete len:235 (-) Transcript_50397:1664-2368(-)
MMSTVRHGSGAPWSPTSCTRTTYSTRSRPCSCDRKAGHVNLAQSSASSTILNSCPAGGAGGNAWQTMDPPGAQDDQNNAFPCRASMDKLAPGRENQRWSCKHHVCMRHCPSAPWVSSSAVRWGSNCGGNSSHLSPKPSVRMRTWKCVGRGPIPRSKSLWMAKLSGPTAGPTAALRRKASAGERQSRRKPGPEASLKTRLALSRSGSQGGRARNHVEVGDLKPSFNISTRSCMAK